MKNMNTQGFIENPHPDYITPPVVYVFVMSQVWPLVYVGSSVTNAPERYLRFVSLFKQELQQLAPTMHVIEWVGKNSRLRFTDFFKRDLNNVRLCDAMIAFVDEPSIGIGMEIREALTRGKPLLCLYKEGTVVSRLLLSAHSPQMRLERYSDLPEALAIAETFIETLPVTLVRYTEGVSHYGTTKEHS